MTHNSNNMYDILQITALKQFRCLGDACEDTCCKNWGMQIGAATIAKYEKYAPELLQAVDVANDGNIMKRDSCSDFCVKYEAGLCSIHRDYGEDFLGDACNFFPRATRKMGSHILMSAALSCPEIVRLCVINEGVISNGAVNNDADNYYDKVQTANLPESIKDYALSDLSDNDAVAFHQILVQHVLSPNITAEQALINITTTLDALAMQPTENWAGATPMYLKFAQGRMAKPQANIADAFNLANILAMLANLTTNQINPRLTNTINLITQALNVQFDANAGTLILGNDSAEIWQNASEKWLAEWQTPLQPVLKKWLATELALNFFPFSGLGDDFVQRLTILCVRYATVRLAIIAHHITHNAMPSDVELVVIIQSLARFLDHLSDAETMLNFCDQAGWNTQNRLNGLLNMKD